MARRFVRLAVGRVARAGAVVALLSWVASAPVSAQGPSTLERELARAFATVDARLVPSGFLLDRALPLSRPGRFDGTPAAPVAGPAALRQILHEVRRASLLPPTGPGPEELRARARAVPDGGVVPIAVVDAQVQQFRSRATEDGSVVIRGGRVEISPAAVEDVRIFAAAAMPAETRRGASTSFAVSRSLWCTAGRPAPRRLEVDLDDGMGYRAVDFDIPVRPVWDAPGLRELRLRATWEDGDVRTARFAFDVVRQETPAPDDTLTVNASVPYGGAAGSGRAYVRLAPDHAVLENPVVVIEGFDLDDTMGWERLYELLNQENLLEELRAAGFDAVVLDFDSATDPIQRNAFVVAELLQQIATWIDPERDVFLVGASMGGLCARYALAWLESQAIDPRVRSFLSFDVPHGGADIPLGLQYWLDFFSDQSADAAYLLSRLDTPAARQMLVYHHATPPATLPAADPLRADFLADLAALGDWPEAPRRIAVSNGSGFAVGQGFAPAEQIVLYEYRSLLVDIDGNVWAVPDGTTAQVFYGRIDFILLPAEELSVVVSGTLPYDNAPGGNRDSMFQMDTTAAPYGDIIALHDRHCFIPTVSALALPGTDLFLDVDGTPDVLSLTPFAAARWASVNEEHVFIAPDTKAWVMAEVVAGPTAAPPAAASAGPVALALFPAFPNPAHDIVTLRFALGRGSNVVIDVFDVAGRRVERILERALPTGTHAVRWTPPAAGVYWWRVQGAGESSTRPVVAVP